MKTISDQFDNYLTTVYPSTNKLLSESQRFQLKMAFYGGFAECFAACRDSAKLETGDAMMTLQAMIDETIDFADEVEAMGAKVRAQTGSN